MTPSVSASLVGVCGRPLGVLLPPKPSLEMASRSSGKETVLRGELVDQDALREALDAGSLALASLDTVTPEPLPAGHWLYDHPRVHLSPHVSWSMPGSLGGLIDPFIENLGRWRTGRALVDLVDVEEGY